MENVLNTALYIVYGLFTLGILVFVHEIGHFIAGKSTGIRVTAFSIGFGRGIFSFKKNDTLYKLGWIPVGGYCRFAGEGEDLKDDRTGAPDEFYERPAWARLITASAGVFLNFVFAIMIFGFLSFFGYSYDSLDNRITVNDKITSTDKKLELPAFIAGLKTGDRILSVNGIKTPNYASLRKAIVTKQKTKIKLKLKRNRKIIYKYVHTGIRSDGAGYINILPYFPAKVQSVKKGSPSEKAGIKSGDLIISFNKIKIDSIYKLQILVQKNKDVNAVVGIRRNNRLINLIIKPYKSEKRYYLGFDTVKPKMIKYHTEKYGFFASIGNAFKMFINNISMTVSNIRLLFRKEVETKKAAAGPLRIILFSGTILKESSLANYLNLLAMISIALGVFNLIPIPGLDGGHIFFTIIEMIRRKRLSFKILQRIQMVGITLILTLFVYILFFDIMNLFGK